MSGITPHDDHLGTIADACRDSAAVIGDRLRTLRAHLESLDPARTGLSRSRLNDLLAGYDIYTRMLDDALHDIADNLAVEAGAPRRSEMELSGGSPR